MMKMNVVVVERPPALEKLGNPPGVLVIGLDGEVQPYLVSLHPRVQTRVRLHQMGLCRLPTAVFPGWGKVERVDLGGLLKRLNGLNEEINLPGDAKKLVMRTRLPLKVDGFANRMGLFSQTGGKWIDGQTGLEFLEWYRSLPCGTSLLIHPDQPELQKQAIHGRFFRGNDGGEELVLATGVVHMRMVDEGEGVVLRVRGSRINDLFLERSKYRGGSLVVVDRIRRETNPRLDFLKMAYQKIVDEFVRKGGVIEFRLYPNDGLHIYDVDWRF